VLWQTPSGEIGTARGVAASAASGRVYVSDQTGRRVIEYTAWGEFVKTWGWDVVSSGPGNKSTAPDPPQFEICVPANNDVCKSGVQGSAGVGQFNAALGIALDSGGNVYVVDAPARRVQKFSSAGEFLLMFGGEVNKTTGANVCTKADVDAGDECGAGTTGAGNGQFGAWPGLHTVIAVDPSDKVYVGDVGRIQRFDTGGLYQGQIDLTGETVNALAAGPLGYLYLAYHSSGVNNKANVRKLDPETGGVLAIFEAVNPRAIAVAADGDVYAFDSAIAKIRHFDPSGAEVEDPFGDGLAATSTGLAVNDVTCGAGDAAVYHSNSSPAFVRAYSPVPNHVDGCVDDPPLGVPPTIGETFARSVGTTSATVGAEINPEFWDDTTYHVEYGTVDCAVGPCQKALLPGVRLTTETTRGFLPAVATLQGLQPGTTYHFRFVVESSGGGPAFGPGATFTTFPLAPAPDTGCSNRSFRTGFGALLPDCRAYEMVSPLDKNNGDIVAPLSVSSLETSLYRAAPDGNRLTYSSYRSFADPQGAPFASQYVAGRDAQDWASEAISPLRDTNVPGPTTDFLVNQFVAFSSDLSTAWLAWDADPQLSPEGLTGYRNLYAMDVAGRTFEAITTVQPPSAPKGGTGSFRPALQGLSADGTHVVFEANDALTADAAPCCSRQLYEHRAGEPLRLVSVLPDGTPSTQDAAVGSTGVGLEGREGHTANAVSADGSRIYWSAGGKLYLRVDGEDPTIEVSAPAATDADFWAAAADGSQALFSEGGDLYRFDLAGGASTLIAEDVRGVAGAADDLSHAYLVSTKALDGVAVEGQSNLYHWQAGEGFDFVAVVESEGDLAMSVYSQALVNRLSRVSPDGRHLAFVTRRPATGYDNTDAVTGEADTEVFHYSAESDRLHCASCNPSGARPSGRAAPIVPSRGPVGNVPHDIAAIIPGHQGHFHAQRVLSDDGRRLFFESFDALLPRDTNGRMDVYQWQTPGSGDCDTDDAHYFDANGGCLALISSGTSAGDSSFVEATPSGNDVFFRTESSLVPQDYGLVDIYDARVGGGFAPPPSPPAPCEGDACQSPARAPEPVAPASEAFRGNGNVTAARKPRPRRCPKGKRKVRRNGKVRCVKRGQGKRSQRSRRNDRRAVR
jgi:sugar lactone lactonase YvrE